LCINPNCASKHEEGAEALADLPEDRGECPKCGKGKMVLRKSIYGTFYGCSNYPKCRNIINADGSANEKKKKFVKKKAVKKKAVKKKTVKKKK
jgi:ssDNA-binding Zn-finger/Zn-ribbon topoisomerase 1